VHIGSDRHWLSSGPGRRVHVDYIDASGADTLNDLARTCNKNGVQLLVYGLSHQPMDIATRCGFVADIGTRHL
jgi:MFS superfamily sulfate permease-like transporter